VDETEWVWIECPECKKPVCAAKGKEADTYHASCGTWFKVAKKRGSDSDQFSEGDD